MKTTLSDTQRRAALRASRGVLVAAIACVPVGLLHALSLSEFTWMLSGWLMFALLLGYGAALGRAGLRLRALAKVEGPVSLDRFAEVFGQALFLRMVLPLLLVLAAVLG